MRRVLMVVGLLLLGGCGPAASPTAPPPSAGPSTATPAAAATAAATVAATMATQTATALATAMPRPTVTPTAPSTVVPPPLEVYMPSSGAALPSPLAPIAVGNAARLAELARWGTGQLSTYAWSADGQTIAAGTTVGVYLYGTQSWQVGRSLPTSASVAVLAFPRQGTGLAAGLVDGTIHLFDAATGEVLATLAGPSQELTDLDYSPDGRLLASSSRDGTVRLWDVASGQEVQALAHGGAVRDVAFSPDGALLVAAAADNTVRLWDVAGGQRGLSPRRGPPGRAAGRRYGAAVGCGGVGGYLERCSRSMFQQVIPV